jgi:Ethylbenzene dehydrogenase
MIRKIIAIFLFIFFGLQGPCYSESRLISVKVHQPPTIDGQGQDAVWQEAREIMTRDNIGNMDIALKSVHTNKEIFFLVSYSDSDESRRHKPWVWNNKKQIYEMGPEREDCFIFKWAMGKEITDLSIHSDQPYRADIWFWKANRTDPAGYADDKHQKLSSIKLPKSQKILSKSGNPMFLQRRGDSGKSAYKSKLYIEYSGESVLQFKNRIPSGSRADVKAKGVWSDNEWCIEFSRSLISGYDDDIQFDLSQQYFFGVSRYEIAGRKPDRKLSQPLYGSGDVSEKFYLTFGN